MIIHVKDFRSSIPALRDNERLFGDARGDDCLTLASISERALDPENRRFRFIASTDALDHDDEIIAPGAFHELRGVYLANPVLLASHLHRLSNGFSTVAGHTLELQTEKNPVWGVGQLVNTAVGKDHGEAIFSGAQKALSVGFRVRETDRQNGTLVHTKGMLLEISLVSVGANPQALVMNYVGGKLGDYGQAAVTDRVQRDEWEAMLDELRADLDAVKTEIRGTRTKGRASAGTEADFAKTLAGAFSEHGA
jgi:HK97 family phage prohead protease